MGLGFVADFFGKPVLLGYINGVVLIVIASQLAKLLGINVEARDFVPIIKEITPRLGEANGATVVLSAGLLAAALAVKRFLPAVPPSLVVLVLGLIVAAVVDLESRGIAVVGETAAGLPPLSLPDNVGLREFLFDLLLPAGAFALVAFCRSDRDRTHARAQARLRDRREQRAWGTRRRESDRRPDSVVPGVLLELSLRRQRLEWCEVAGRGCSSPPRSSGSFSSLRCL